MAKSAKGKSSTGRTAARRQAVGRNLPRPAFDYGALLQRPDFLQGTLVALVFVLVASAVIIWSRERTHVHVGQVMTDTRIKRVDFEVRDVEATRLAREEARKSSPRVYRLNTTWLARVEAALEGLPKAVAGKTSLEEISPELRDAFELTPEMLGSLQAYARDGDSTPHWRRVVSRLMDDVLPANPVVRSEDFELVATADDALLILDAEMSRSIKGRAIELQQPITEDLALELTGLVNQAGFPPSVSTAVYARLVRDLQPTALFDPEATADLSERRAAEVPEVVTVHKAGELIYGRGDALTAGQFELLHTEADEFRARIDAMTIWLPRVAVTAFTVLLGAFITAYVVLFYPRLVRNPLRITALCALMCLMLALTVLLSTQVPKIIYGAAIAPTLVVVVVMLLAYDRRIAMFLGIMQGALVALALQQSIGWFLLLAAGCGSSVVQLREVRHRNSLIRAAMITAAVLGVGAILLGVFEIPLVPGAWRQIMLNALLASAASFGVGFFILGILPSIEKAFDITTGMTLAELRDPKQPLLRQLQQKAPGTYNHSLQVANIAEAAAEAIGADGLLVYVGALYHDIGKMNKPEYFVENQTGGNKHEKLSPTMSLLVIVGHVKDGVELAREYGLPRQVQHFIEAHHGTTLVEYFYHAAKEQAEAAERGDVHEVEFRYPGPRPRTKEAAILMLSDAVESATRAMAEPTPSRIDNLVRELSRKRLADGQFDDCQLTFRELSTIEESVIKSVCAIYHGRISYPTTTAAARAEEPLVEGVTVKPQSA